MTREQQYWEDTQEALSRIFDRCEEIDPQSGYEMLGDIQFIRGFINKHIPRAEKQEPIIDKIRAEIVELTKCPYGTECLGANCPSNTDCMICGDHVLEILDKYKSESEPQESESDA